MKLALIGLSSLLHTYFIEVLLHVFNTFQSGLDLHLVREEASRCQKIAMQCENGKNMLRLQMTNDGAIFINLLCVVLIAGQHCFLYTSFDF